MVLEQTPEMKAAVTELWTLMHPEDEWAPSIAPIDETAKLLNSPLGRLVRSLGDTPDPSLRTRRWGRLCVSACRRVRASWELQCDTDPLTPRIDAANARLIHGTEWNPNAGFKHCPWPTCRGQDLRDDCSIHGPNLAALAVTWCVAFAEHPTPNLVVGCVRDADRAISESDLGNRDVFRGWVLDFAVPAAYEDRDLTEWEENALRDYNIHDVRRWRDAARDSE